MKLERKKENLSGAMVSAVRWGVAGNIITAWIVTLPAAMMLGGIAAFIIGWVQ